MSRSYPPAINELKTRSACRAMARNGLVATRCEVSGRGIMQQRLAEIASQRGDVDVVEIAAKGTQTRNSQFGENDL